MPLTFKAVQFKNKNTPLEVKTVTLPVQTRNGELVVGTNELLVKVHATALNPVDLLLRNAMLPLLFRGDKGFGFDYCGDVAAIGAAAAAKSGLSVGDRVAGLYQDALGPGTIAEYILIDPSKPTGLNARKIPDHFSYQQGAAYPLVFGTAQTLFDFINKGNSYNKILVLGAGTSVGRYVVQLAKQLYHSTEIVVTCSGRTAEAIAELGATKIIDYTKHKSILNPVLELVKESGKFDAILDCCGNGDLFPEITTILQDREHHGTYNTVTGDHKSNFLGSMLGLMVGNLSSGFRAFRSKIGLLPYYYNLCFVNPLGPWPDRCAENLASGKVKVFIDSEYPMEDVKGACDRLLSNKAVGKVIVNVV